MRISTLFAGSTACAVTSLAYLGAVPPVAAFQFVLVSVVVAIGATILLRRFTSSASFLVTGTATVLWSLVVNAVSGDQVGPSARSSAVCGLASCIALYGVRTLRTAVFLGGIFWSIAGAMNYGSAGEVMPVIAILLLTSAATANLIFRDTLQLRFDKRKLPHLSVALLFAIALTFSLVKAFNSIFTSIGGRDQPTVSKFLSVQQFDYKPPWQPSNVSVDELPAQSFARPVSDHSQLLSNVFFEIIVIALSVVLIAVAIRLIHMQLHRLTVKRRLRMQDTSQVFSGAWRWLVINADLLSMWPYSNVSVDQIARDGEPRNWGDKSSDKLRDLAGLTMRSLFDRSEFTSGELSKSWILSQDLVSIVKSQTPIIRRIIARFRRLG